ncbi:unnamed protein product [Boreogadus saida]
MDDERLVVEVEKYVELYDQSSRHYKDNSKKVIAWRAIALEIGSSGDFLHLYCSAAVAPPPVGARGVLLTRVKCAPCRCGAGGWVVRPIKEKPSYGYATNLMVSLAEEYSRSPQALQESSAVLSSAAPAPLTTSLQKVAMDVADSLHLGRHLRFNM